MFSSYETAGTQRKTPLILIIIIAIMLSLDLPQIPTQAAPTTSSHDQDIFTPEDQGDHFPCGCEWWTFEVNLLLENGTHWEILIQFQYTTNASNRSEITSFWLLLYCFNRDNGDMLDFTMLDNKGRSNKTIPFFFKKNMIDLRYKNCTMNGLYPCFTTYIENDVKSFMVNLSLNATSSPHWVAQEASNGYFPWGLGWARYGFIPSLNVSGSIHIEGATLNATGVGYFEHAWGNFTYGTSKKTLANLREFVQSLQKTLPFVKWCLSERSNYSHQPWSHSTDNFFGYEWIWTIFDNGWSLHCGIFHMFESMDGPVFGELSLTPDGETYWDSADLSIHYNRMQYLPEADAHLPLDIEITATKGNTTLHLVLNTTTEPFPGCCVYPRSIYSCGQGGLQSAGIMEGYWKDTKQNVSLHGNCSLASTREYLNCKYNSLIITPLSAPQQGFSADLVLDRFSFELYIERQVLPYQDLYIHFTPLKVKLPGKPSGQTYDGPILYVGGGGADNYSTIQDAVDHASAGDTVFVCGGEFRENIVIDKAIRLVGEDKTKVLLHAGLDDGIKTIADNVEITGFTIEAEKADTYNDAPIYLASSGNYVHDNNLTKSEWYGLIAFNSSSDVIENNSIYDNDIGIWLCRTVDSIVRFNNIAQSNWVGIWLWPYSKDNTICYNNFIGNKLNARNSDVTTRNSWSHNYWDDYNGLKWTPIADLNGDGVGNIPYKISRWNRDWHPLMEPYLLGFV
jgi:parallel beta-helix repeat protein